MKSFRDGIRHPNQSFKHTQNTKLDLMVVLSIIEGTAASVLESFFSSSTKKQDNFLPLIWLPNYFPNLIQVNCQTIFWGKKNHLF